MSAVRNWLEEIGLAQYANAFEANDIDTDLLTQIDDQVLKDIGVSSAGHRLRLRNAIAKLAPRSITEGISEVPASSPPSQAERRQLTVMFCDLVGSTPLSTRFDPEDLREIVGDLIGAGAAQERGVVGETPNLAARLQALARPGTLVVAESTRRQIGTLFEIEDLGPRPLAGFVEPQRAWRVVSESGVVSRFEALRSGTTPLVGRDEELDLLLRRWQHAKSGEGRVVLVSGEPGIGKSRLTAALSQRIESEPHTRLRYFCSPHDQDSALYPFIGQLERAAGFTRDDTATTKLDKLEALIGDAAEPGDISLIIEMLSLSGGERFPPLDLSPQRKKERTLAALLRQLQALARRQPILAKNI